MPVLFRILLAIFAVLTVGLALLHFFSGNFHPELSTAYPANLLPRLWQSLLAGGAQAFHMLADLAAKLVQFIWTTITAVFTAVIDSFHASTPVANAPVRAPPPPPATVPLPAPVPPPPAVAPAAASSGFFSVFLQGYLEGFAVVLAARTLIYTAAWRFNAYRVQWPGGPNSRSLPVLEFYDSDTNGLLILSQIACLIAAFLFLFGGGVPGYSGAVLGFIGGGALPIVPRSFFWALRLLNIDPKPPQPRAGSHLIEEGEIVRLSLFQYNRSIAAATFKKPYQSIPADTDLSTTPLLDLAAIAGALRIVDQLPRDADLLERYLDHRAPDWRQQAETAAAAEDEQASAEQQSSGMTRAEALEILDLKEGATDADIDAAYKRLMMQVHPDRGGSTFFAKQLNEARKVMLG
jgi:hypothetical protein